jgi:hypothetical protein
VEEYGAEGFNHRTEEFRNLISKLGCNVSGEDYADRFDCDKSEFERAIKIMVRYKEQGICLKTDDLFTENEHITFTADDIQSYTEKIGDDIDFIIREMKRLLETADPDESYIYFVCY